MPMRALIALIALIALLLAPALAPLAEPAAEPAADADELLCPEPEARASRWELDGEGPPRWIVEEADGPDGPWSRRAEVSPDEPVGVPFQPVGGS